MHAELLNLYLFAWFLGKELVITGIAPVVLFEMLHAKFAERRLAAEPRKWPRPEPDPEPEPEEEPDYGKAAIGALAA